MTDGANDPYVVQAGHLPTPFTAAEIRGATPVGLVVETIAEEAGDVVSRRRTTFVACDDDGATVENVEIDEDGNVLGAVESGRSTWHDLQGHASFPAEQADRTSEMVELPIGTLECWRYEVRFDGRTSTFWFAKDLPGQPVRYAVHLDEGRDRITTVTGLRRPA